MGKFKQINGKQFLPQEFNHREISEYSKFVSTSYLSHFMENGYIEQKSVDIVAQDIDPSVLFIGSTISALKHMYLNNKIPACGVVINQLCIRTHNLKKLYTERQNKGNTVFELIGGLSEVSKFSEVYNLSLRYFYEKVKIEKESLFVKASSADKDILESIKKDQNSPKIEIDGRKLDYYRWKYGIPGVSGRGIAFSVRNKFDKKKSMTLGNIILMESNQLPSAVQWGFGISSIICGKYGKEKVIEGSLISQVVPYDKGPNSKFADSLTAVIEMYNSGLKPSNRGVDSYLKAYLRGLAYLMQRDNINQNDLSGYVKKYCDLRIIANHKLISKQIINEIKSHNSSVDKFLQKMSGKDIIELKKIIAAEKEIVKISNKYKIHPDEVRIIINRLLKKK